MHRKVRFAAIITLLTSSLITAGTFRSGHCASQPHPRPTLEYSHEFVPSHEAIVQSNAFALGSDDKHISVVDEGGVALAAIQGLNEKLEKRNAELEAKNAALERRLEAIEKRLPAN